MISFRRARGDLLITLHTVLNKVLQASLWNTITMEVVGNNLGYTLLLHLKSEKKGFSLNEVTDYAVNAFFWN